MRNDPIKNALTDADPTRDVRLEVRHDIKARILLDAPAPQEKQTARAPRRTFWSRPRTSVAGALAAALLVILATQVLPGKHVGRASLLEQAAAAISEPAKVFHFVVHQRITQRPATQVRFHLARFDVWATSDGQYRRVDLLDAQGQSRTVTIQTPRHSFDYRLSREDPPRVTMLTIGPGVGCEQPGDLAWSDIHALLLGATGSHSRLRLLSERRLGPHVVLQFLRVAPPLSRCDDKQSDLRLTVTLDGTTFLPERMEARYATNGRVDPHAPVFSYQYKKVEVLPVSRELLQYFNGPR